MKSEPAPRIKSSYAAPHREEGNLNHVDSSSGSEISSIRALGGNVAVDLLLAEPTRIEIDGRHQRCLEGWGFGGNRCDRRCLPNQPATGMARAAAKAVIATHCDFIHALRIPRHPDPRILDALGARAYR